MIVFAIPAYNEEGAIGPLLVNIARAMDDERLDYRVFVVDDGSTDGTAAEVEAMRESSPSRSSRTSRTRASQAPCGPASPPPSLIAMTMT